MEKPKNLPEKGGLLARFAQLLGTKVENNRVTIPEQYGKGYTTVFVLSHHIAMIINNHVLYKEIAFRSPENTMNQQMVFFKFNNIIAGSEDVSAVTGTKELPSVQISTMGLNPYIILPKRITRSHINIMVEADYLRDTISFPEKSPAVRTILENNRPLLFEQIVHPSFQKIANEIITGIEDKSLELFFYRIKAEELVCRLLIELGKREDKKIYPLNAQDIQTIYKVRERLLESLDTSPTIDELAAFANMSLSKLKRIFKQVFGDSIFNYYQAFRMQEAARLLKEGKWSVSEVGYRIGFSNLSHFSRVFEQHMGMKPKKYTQSYKIKQHYDCI
jgi:AraC-like DNA-binding protein